MIEARWLAEIRRDHERRGLLPATIRKRHIQMRALGVWMGSRSMWDATSDDINLFLDARDINSRSRYTWLASLHVMFQWGIETGYTTTDPTLTIVRPKMRRMLPRPLATEDLRVALATADRQMQAWLMLGALQGLRCQEIAGLRREDLIVPDKLLRVVFGKGGYERLLPLHPEVDRVLASLPAFRSGWLFERPQGGRFSAHRVSVLIAAHLRSAGVEGTAHQLRHWFGSTLYRGTHDLRLVQEMMGHQTPATTAIYTAFDHRAARQAVTALSVEPLDAA